MDKVSPRPLYVWQDSNKFKIAATRGNVSFTIAECHRSENAERLAICANAHDALVAALKELAHCHDGHSKLKCSHPVVKEALKAAGEL